MLLILSFFLVIQSLLPIYCFTYELSCHNFFINNEKFECPNGSVYIASEDRCVDVTKFNCQKNSWNVVEYLPDPYLCNVHHMCLNGEEVGRICCSSRQIFNLELQSCIELPEGSENDCSSDPCASKFLEKTCSFSYESKAVSYDVPECPTSRAEREQPTLRVEETNNFWREGRAAEASCEGFGNFETYCLNCATDVFCYGPTPETIAPYNTTCESGSACLLTECATLTASSECACTGNVGINYKQDPHSPESYVTCIDETPVYITCESGSVPDLSTGTCITPTTTNAQSTTITGSTTIASSTTAPKPCTASGTVKLSCTEYQVCSGNGATPIYGKCPAEHFFDVNKNKCMYGYNFTCTTSGAFSDPYDCRRSYVCNRAVLVATSCCSAATQFDNATQACIAPSCQSNYECKPGAIASTTTPIPTGSTTTTPISTSSSTTTPIPTNSPTTTPVPTISPTTTPSITNSPPTTTPIPTNSPTTTPIPIDSTTTTPIPTTPTIPTDSTTTTPISTNSPTTLTIPTDSTTTTPISTNSPTTLTIPTDSTTTTPISTNSPTTLTIPTESTTTTPITTNSPTTTTTSTTTSTASPVSPNPEGSCLQSEEGNYFYDPDNAKKYFQCQNQVLVSYECPGKTYFDCIYLYCTLPEYISGCVGIP